MQFDEIVNDEFRRSFGGEMLPRSAVKRKKTALPKELRRVDSDTSLSSKEFFDAHESCASDSDSEVPCINGQSAKQFTTTNSNMEITCLDIPTKTVHSEDIIEGTAVEAHINKITVDVVETQDMSPLVISSSLPRTQKDFNDTYLSSLRLSKASTKKESVTSEELSSLRVSVNNSTSSKEVTRNLVDFNITSEQQESG